MVAVALRFGGRNAKRFNIEPLARHSRDWLICQLALPPPSPLFSKFGSTRIHLLSRRMTAAFCYSFEGMGWSPVLITPAPFLEEVVVLCRIMSESQPPFVTLILWNLPFPKVISGRMIGRATKIQTIEYGAFSANGCKYIVNIQNAGYHFCPSQIIPCRWNWTEKSRVQLRERDVGHIAHWKPSISQRAGALSGCNESPNEELSEPYFRRWHSFFCGSCAFSMVEKEWEWNEISRVKKCGENYYANW